MEEPEGSYAPQSPDLSAVSYYPDNPTAAAAAAAGAASSSSYPLQPPHSYQPPYSHMQGHEPQQLPDPYYPHQDQSRTYSSHPHLQNTMPVSTRSGRVKNEDPDWLPPAAIPANVPPLLQNASPFASFPKEEPKAAPGEVEGIVVKTKFPVARIKRIVQADEDIGKVAQVTPVVVAKALELFMISLATKSADEARARGSKKITGAHLKQAVQKDEQFDFLNDIVSKIADAPSSKKEKEDDSDDGMDGAGGVKRKKSATSRRKRKEREDS